MKKLTLTVLLLLSLGSAIGKEEFEVPATIDLEKDRVLYSRLYQSLSEEDKVLLFSTKKKFMDRGGLVPDVTVACTRWIGISTVVRQDSGNHMEVEEIYFDIDDSTLLQ